MFEESRATTVWTIFSIVQWIVRLYYHRHTWFPQFCTINLTIITFLAGAEHRGMENNHSPRLQKLTLHFSFAVHYHVKHRFLHNFSRHSADKGRGEDALLDRGFTDLNSGGFRNSRTSEFSFNAGTWRRRILNVSQSCFPHRPASPRPASRNGREEDISILSGWDRWRSPRGSRVQFREGILVEKRAGYPNFRILTRGSLTGWGRGSDINIALPKRNTLSRGKFPPEDQGSKLLKSFPGVPNSADFGTVRRARVFRKNDNVGDRKSLCKISVREVRHSRACTKPVVDSGQFLTMPDDSLYV